MLIEQDALCWTKYGTESGENISSIFERKENERLSNNGIFLWGVGNSLSTSIMSLLSNYFNPKLVFSPMKSKPAEHDVYPDNTVIWTKGYGIDGFMYTLPTV